jgi:hypothetical protein
MLNRRPRAFSQRKRSCRPGQPSSYITPIALLLLAGILDNKRWMAEAIRLVHSWGLIMMRREAKVK